MNYLINPLLEIQEYSDAVRSIRNYGGPVYISGPSDSQKVHISYALCSHTGEKGVFITYNDMQARKMYEDFSFFLGEEVVYFPSKEIMLHDIEAKSNDEVYQRINTLDRLISGDFLVVVTSAEALAQKLPSRETFEAGTIRIEPGGILDLGDIASKLVHMGYERMPSVEAKGQFSIRGGILDIFSVNYEHPVRIELFDDEVDSIRKFDIMTQRSIDKLQSFKAIPARDMIYAPGELDSIISSIEEDRKNHLSKTGSRMGKDYVKNLGARISADVERFRSHYYFPGMDRYIPYLAKHPACLLDFVPEAVVFLDEPARFEQRLENILLENEEACKILMEKAVLLPQSTGIYFDAEDLKRAMEKRKMAVISTFPTDSGILGSYRSFSIPCKSMASYQGQFDLLVEDISQWKGKGSRLIILCGPRGRGERLSGTLRTREIEAAYYDSFEGEVQPGQIVITHGSLNRGFEYPSIGLAVVSDKEVFGLEKKVRRAGRKKIGDKIKAFSDLSVGDYVVHQTHGIGQYVGIQKLVVDNVKKDYLKIRYNAGDYLYIPTNQLDLIQKYIGADGKTPKLNRLGGSEWSKTKSRVKESLKQLAVELVKLYAQRQAIKGHAFAPDTVWQAQFEELFPFEETDDQLKCIEEIKKDMESDKPMERLLCGDVGYGKTEVAIRALFKAVMDGKQVAYLVPTTVLAQQQYTNFKERLKDFPVTVEMISRFRTPGQQRQILRDVKSGKIDVLVGTHRLLQKDIQFKDLGLLIVDEEQRFGVEHKESIKNRRPDIDVLTLTATPIPRTLHMSLVGIRDISVIEDPPEERYPVQTYVMEYNADVIRDAINRELSRHGQVFYLYNRVRSIQLKAAELQALVPDARIAVAHGQMNEHQLEDIMYAFIKGEYDILVCTTIIESGLDMPNVNTMIVEDADRMGLSQLYQIRGRVGRSNRLAYAYITYKKDKVLSEIAEKRLQAIKEFTEFGSGFKIAMRDLEIRGAGNLLGPEQHGHMEAVGYDMYCRLLNEAVREIKGEEYISDEAEVTIDINISAYIDDEYINSESKKIEMYQRIASIQDEQDAMDVEDELVDRYGDLPEPVRNLISVASIKYLARACGFESIQEKNDAVILQFRKGAQVKLDAIGKLMEKYRRKLMFTASNNPYITFRTTGIGRDKLLENIKILLQDIIELKS